MTSDRLRQVQRILDDVLEKAPAERAAFVADACGGDAELRSEVESLLAQDQQVSPDFMRPPEPPPEVRQTASPSGPDPLLGERIGGFRIKSVIASGGMGTVYLAEQEQPRRDVAVKVLRVGIASGSALRRFEFESEVLARLRHPNIAQVHEAGTHHEEGMAADKGVPYFVMEYIPEARTIIEYADQERLDTRQRLKLFTTACEAVHHGHQKGIIHRDLKPANILVDSVGQVKIIDFGVARSTDSDVALTTMRTDVGQLIGTLQYMSPEQCDADPHELDTRSDVYSLAVVLYELLAGQPPYDATRSTIYQATRIIKEQAPRKLSDLNRRLRGDVETIVLKALEKDRDRRYQSAADMAQDIRRFFNREPIEAKPPSAWTRALRWAARHPAISTIAATGLCTAAVVALATLIAVWHVNARPHRMWRSDDGREARLLSAINGVLHTWTAEAPGGIRLAELVGRPSELGGGRLALLAFDASPGVACPRSLCAFDAEGDLKDPIWTCVIETDDILLDLKERGLVGADFVPDVVHVADVFPERPGREIVAVFSCIYSPRLIRIYDLGGELLYQVWHDGGIGICCWVSRARLLVFSGTNAEAYWHERGYPKLYSAHPRVTFAVRPRLGFVSDGWLRSVSGDGPLNPVWYKCLFPPNAREIITGPIRVLLGHGAHRDYLQFSVTVDEAIGAAVSWIVDDDGNDVPGTRVLTDGYELDRHRLPDPDQFRLRPLPPIVSTPGDDGLAPTAENGNP